MGDTNKKNIIGIDFGTSFSQVAVKHNGIVSRLCDAGNYGVPSLFFYNSTEGECVGKRAKSQASFDPENLVKEVKMSLNNKYTLDGREYSAKEIVGKIYRALVLKAKERGPMQIIDFDLGGVVITHPAEFKMPEVSLLKDAAANCLGPSEPPINVVGAIKEPVAAALSYFEKAKDGIRNGDGVLVVDVGGGTTDIALVVRDDTKLAEFEVIDVGMERKGGRDFDQRLFDFVADKIEEMTNGERVIRGNFTYENYVSEEVNFVKHQLTEAESAIFSPGITYHAAISRGIKVTKQAFEELTKDLLDDILKIVHKVYDANKDKIDIKHIICVGGSSNMPMIERTISEHFPECNVRVDEPEYAVVNGAAIYANKLQEANIQEVDILPFSYGVRCKSGDKQCIRNILIRGDKFPAVGSCKDFKSSNESNSIQVDVFESKIKDTIFEFDQNQVEFVGTITLQSQSLISTTEQIECELTMNDLSTISINVAHDSKDQKTATFTIKSAE